jgi:ankyrin repeat protein
MDLHVTHHHIGTPGGSDYEVDDEPHNDGWKMHVSQKCATHAYFYCQLTDKIESRFFGITNPFEAVLACNIQWLLAYIAAGGSWDVVGQDRMTLMHFAATISSSIVELLLCRMKRPQIPDQNGITPIAIACRYGNLEIVRLLISNGAIVTSVCRRGNTSLHEASMFGQYHCLRHLLDLVTSDRYRHLLSHIVWAKNVSGKTCYDVAIESGFTECGELALKYMKSDIFNASSM